METLDKKLVAKNFESIEDLENCHIEPDELEQKEKTVTNYRDKKLKISTNLKTLKSSLQQKTKPDMQLLKDEQEEIEKKCSKLEEEKNQAAYSISELKRKKSEYDDLLNEINNQRESSKLYIEIADELNGKNPKNVNFKNFILSAYLQEVTKYGSGRFNKMSEGRYFLKVSDEIADRRKAAGLELKVFDTYTGHERSVKSLSGGEKFMASISLALGLADVIQARAGGVEMDAMFIDEGFGSLDSENLDRALNILDEIRSDRMVGIISHVEELRNRIPSQLIVKKSSKGSEIKIL